MVDPIPKAKPEEGPTTSPAIEVDDEADTEVAVNKPVDALISEPIVDDPIYTSINVLEPPPIANKKFDFQLVDPFGPNAEPKDQFDLLLLPSIAVQEASLPTTFDDPNARSVGIGLHHQAIKLRWWK